MIPTPRRGRARKRSRVEPAWMEGRHWRPPVSEWCVFHKLCIFTRRKMTLGHHGAPKSQGNKLRRKSIWVIPPPRFLNSKPPWSLKVAEGLEERASYWESRDPIIVLGLPLTCHVMPLLSGPQFPHLHNGDSGHSPWISLPPKCPASNQNNGSQCPAVEWRALAPWCQP